jgi:hypothetical protein
MHDQMSHQSCARQSQALHPSVVDMSGADWTSPVSDCSAAEAAAVGAAARSLHCKSATVH